MTLLYNKIQRGVPGKPEEPKKWYIFVKTLGQIAEKEATPATVTSINIRFKPGKELNTAISAATFRPVE